MVGSGLLMAVATIVWAIGSGQFEDQQRARFLPLSGLSASEMNSPRTAPRFADRFGMTAIWVSGLCAIGAALILTLKHM